MSYLDPVESPQSQVSPALLMGAASPLWSYFAAATAGGLAFWWMTRWTRPVNLEALFAAASPQAAPALETVEVIADIVAETPVVATFDPEPEVTVFAEAIPEPEVASELDAASLVEPEPDQAAAPVLIAVADGPEPAPAQKLRAKKFTPESPEPEA